MLLPWKLGGRACSALTPWGLMLLPGHTECSGAGNAPVLGWSKLRSPWHFGRRCAGSASIPWGRMLLLLLLWRREHWSCGQCLDPWLLLLRLLWHRGH